MKLDEKIELAVKWISDSNRLVVFTGAGISTHSGLPDFRGPDGVWTRRDKNLPPPKSLPWDQVKPNEAHYAIVELMKIGKLRVPAQPAELSARWKPKLIPMTKNVRWAK